MAHQTDAATDAQTETDDRSDEEREHLDRFGTKELARFEKGERVCVFYRVGAGQAHRTLEGTLKCFYADYKAMVVTDSNRRLIVDFGYHGTDDNPEVREFDSGEQLGEAAFVSLVTPDAVESDEIDDAEIATDGGQAVTTNDTGDTGDTDDDGIDTRGDDVDLTTTDTVQQLLTDEGLDECFAIDCLIGDTDKRAFSVNGEAADREEFFHAICTQSPYTLVRFTIDRDHSQFGAIIRREDLVDDDMEEM